ncbi:uncharacterized protein LOC125378607 isoform X2 [Haliotis rufescens]|uniref:uncharacterized protein LOC125378607 isoform X2 n=1 Tax=Haliotis rufescens TaxID=6454 RepID=UPI00201EAFE4|nr:uncharacterized protein LOC125378607 isoform X2 [Haliotis rufescens]XP_048250271.1 uncharacterized protein LOC125378607 isoform X2 [Haliotis rufescens]
MYFPLVMVTTSETGWPEQVPTTPGLSWCVHEGVGGQRRSHVLPTCHGDYIRDWVARAGPNYPRLVMVTTSETGWPEEVPCTSHLSWGLYQGLGGQRRSHILPTCHGDYIRDWVARADLNYPWLVMVTTSETGWPEQVPTTPGLSWGLHQGLGGQSRSQLPPACHGDYIRDWVARAGPNYPRLVMGTTSGTGWPEQIPTNPGLSWCLHQGVGGQSRSYVLPTCHGDYIRDWVARAGPMYFPLVMVTSSGTGWPEQVPTTPNLSGRLHLGLGGQRRSLLPPTCHGNYIRDWVARADPNYPQLVMVST